MSLENTITTFGYPGISLATFLEGEVVAFMAGVLAHRGLFTYPGAVLAVFIGAVLSDNAAFLAGRHLGRGRLATRLFDTRAAGAARRLVARNTDLAAFGCRFVYGGKVVTAALVGTTPIAWARFAVLDLVGAAIWSILVVGLGYLAGNAISEAFGHLRLDKHVVISLAVAVALAVGIAIFMHRRRHP